MYIIVYTNYRKNTQHYVLYNILNLVKDLNCNILTFRSTSRDKYHKSASDMFLWL